MTGQKFVDARHIDLGDASEVAYWTKYLNVAEAVLRAAVGMVGPRAQDVKEHLARME